MQLTGQDILVVDDNQTNLELLAQGLGMAGFQVRKANSGTRALDEAFATTPALILLDVRLPDIDGYEVCRQLKANERTRDVPVLFISGMEDETSRVQGFKAGGVDYIPKPFRWEEVLARVRTHLELRQAHLEQARMYERLMRLQRLESIGMLAGGIAHEINNPLSVILNYAELAMDELPPEGTAAGHIREIIAHGGRMAGIVRNLLLFAQQERQDRRPARLDEIVDSAIGLLRSSLQTDGIRIDLELPKDLPEVPCHQQQIQQVLVNLLRNARDALNERHPDSHQDKTIRITAERRSQSGRDLLRLTIENTGTPIPPDVLPRIFEPFFTTKPRGVGTGLGLAASHGIVVEHHGSLTVESNPGSPTRFHLDLPTGSVAEEDQP
jgi:signal transduction histidine kinase